jgi:hypothetical protein
VLNYTEEYDPAAKLLLVIEGEDGEFISLPDQDEGDTYFGGAYEEGSKSYWFRISFYMQDILNGGIAHDLLLLPSASKVKASETVIYGTNPGDTNVPKIQVEIIYTEVE